MSKLWTKDEEREQLRKIKELIQETEDGSYIRMAFCGCVALAEENIDNDFVNSFPDMLGRQEKQIEGYRNKLKNAESLIEVLKHDCENWERNSHEAGELYCELEKECAELQKELEQAKKDKREYRESTEKLLDDQEAEIMRLKAEIYDLRKECGK